MTAKLEPMLSNNNPSLILIVDDDEVNQEILSSFLEQNRYRTLVVSSAKDAITEIESELPDLILLDILMPDMDGFELCKILQDSPATSNIPIIFLTILNKVKDIVKGFQFGGVDYVTKPFNHDVLLARVGTHLELRKARQLLEKKILEQQGILAQVKQLSGLLPICASCKKIRDDKGYWNQLEVYISGHSEVDFSHCLCPRCAQRIKQEIDNEF